MDERRADGLPWQLCRERALPASSRAPRLARNEVRDVLSVDQRFAGVLQDAELVVSELVANAVCHAGTGAVLRIWASPGGVRLEVEDFAPGLRPAPRHPMPEEPSGRGLRVVASVSSDWGWRPDGGGKTVWAVLGTP